MDRLEVKYQEEKFEEVPGILKLDITMVRRQHDNKKKEMRGQLSSGELDYGDKALQESRLQSYSKHTKTDQVKDRYIHTLEKNFDHLTLCIGTTSPLKRKFFLLHLSYYFLLYHLYFGYYL